jgi:hypothetical protein
MLADVCVPGSPCRMQIGMFCVYRLVVSAGHLVMSSG